MDLEMWFQSFNALLISTVYTSECAGTKTTIRAGVHVHTNRTADGVEAVFVPGL